MKLLGLIIKHNIVKIISLIIGLSTFYCWTLTERNVNEHKYEIEHQMTIDGDKYFIMWGTDGSGTAKLKVEPVLKKYELLEVDGKSFFIYSDTSVSFLSGLFMALFIISCIVFFCAHWDGFFDWWIGWNIKQILEKYYEIKLRKVIDGDRVFYVIRGRVIFEKLLDKDYIHDNPIPNVDLRPYLDRYNENPRLFDKYNGNKSERRNKRLDHVLSKN